MTHPWKSSGEKRTVWWYYSPSDSILLYLRDMREATRYGVIDIPTNNIVSIQNDFSRRRRRIQKHLRNPQKRKKKIRTHLNRWPYNQFQRMMEYKSKNRTIYVNPEGTEMAYASNDVMHNSA